MNGSKTDADWWDRSILMESYECTPVLRLEANVHDTSGATWRTRSPVGVVKPGNMEETDILAVFILNLMRCSWTFSEKVWEELTCVMWVGCMEIVWYYILPCRSNASSGLLYVATLGFNMPRGWANAKKWPEGTVCYVDWDLFAEN